VRASLGKPKGSLNKKTVDKLRRLIESAETGETSGEEARYAQNIIARSLDGRGTTNRSSSRSSLAPEPPTASSSSVSTESNSTQVAEPDRLSCLDDLQLAHHPGGASPIQHSYDPTELDLDWEAEEANAGISGHRTPPVCENNSLHETHNERVQGWIRERPAHLSRRKTQQ
jgi:hypothetical protein